MKLIILIIDFCKSWIKFEKNIINSYQMSIKCVVFSNTYNSNFDCKIFQTCSFCFQKSPSCLFWAWRHRTIFLSTAFDILAFRCRSIPNMLAIKHHVIEHHRIGLGLPPIKIIRRFLYIHGPATSCFKCCQVFRVIVCTIMRILQYFSYSEIS